MRYRQRLHAFWTEKGLLQAGEQRLCDQMQIIQKKGWLSQLQLEEIWRLAESRENNFEAQQDVQNRTGTEPIQMAIEQHIAQNEEDKRRGEENPELLRNYDNIDTVEKQKILKKNVELMKKDNLPNPKKPKKN